MLSFSTEFPVSSSDVVDDFKHLVSSWIADSPHTDIAYEELNELNWKSGAYIYKKSQNIELKDVDFEDERLVAIRNTIFEENVRWISEVVLYVSGSGNWVSVRVARESNFPLAHLPAARRPVIVRNLVNKFKGSLDGEIPLSDEVIKLTSSDIDLATKIVSGNSLAYLPIVYISIGFDANYHVDIQRLASDVAGMAHVVVEPNRAFSQRLQINVGGENVYGGTVGVYWPDGAGRKSFFVGNDIGDSDELREAIRNEIRSALLNRRPLSRCSWSNVQEFVSKHEIEALRSSGSADIERYVSAFDDEIKSLKQKILEAENEVSRLKVELRSVQSKSFNSGGVYIRTGVEQSYFDGEIEEIVYDALSASINNQIDGSRRYHVLKSIVSSLEKRDRFSILRNELKDLLRDYRNFSSELSKSLQRLGFSVDRQGAHPKIVYRGDDRYTFVLSSSGSDWRGGLNAASEIAKKVF
jgi:hypothetical protein